ncbi:MAG: TonB-dependent receptor, partial [Bacteroidales bacterium]|nr:TonB-dependent receptor [Bacteroidales bacterium]
MKKSTLILMLLLIAGLQYIAAQGVTITGTTTDAGNGESLPGVTIQVKGTTTGAISTAEGTYRITNVPDNATTLVFSFVGYRTQEVEIAGRTVIDLSLEEEITFLDEVVVTGYSVERKKDIIGSVAVVNTDEMLTTPSGSLTAQLAGRVAGVSIASDGSLGGTSKVRVRGFGSFASSEPLYIIDGVPSESVENINPNDIESVQFLKDAASASVYGSRAASGVVIITTRQGKSGPVQVNLDAYYGINYVSPDDFPDMLDAEEWGELIWTSMNNAGLTPSHAQYGSGTNPVIPEYVLAFDRTGQPRGGAYLEALKVNDPEEFQWMVSPDNYDYATHQIVKSANTDWFDEVYNPAPVTNVQLSAAGGSDRGNFAVAMNYFDQEQVSDAYSYYTRYTVRANSTFNIIEVIRLGENLQVSYNEGRDVGFPASAWTMPALLPVWDIAGNPSGGKAPDISKTFDGNLGNNPIGVAWHNRFDNYYTFSIFGNIFAEATLFKELLIRSSFGLDYFNRQNRDLTQTTYENAETNGVPDRLLWQTSDKRAWTWTNTATYGKTLGAHTVRLLLGTEAIRQIDTRHSAQVDNFVLNDIPSFLVPDAGTGTRAITGNYTPFSLFSYFGRFDYTYGDKYIINATIRRDGSSKFGENSRFGNFPSAAIGWRISQEEFMQGIPWLTDMKLRASYGIVGNQSGLDYNNQFTTFVTSTTENYSISGASSSVSTSYTKNRKGNSDARWEKTTTQNYGLDATFFAGSLSLNVDYYIKKTTDLLVRNQPPMTEANVTQPFINVGDIKNTGLDVMVTHRGKIAGQLDYELSANISTYKNEVLKIMDDPSVALYGGNTRLGDATITRVGEEISSFYGWKLDGFIDDDAELASYQSEISGGSWLAPRLGGWKIVDQNGDGRINDDDRVILGSPHPDFQVGINLSLAWKGIDFSAFVFWNQGGYLFNDSRYNVDFNTYAYNRSARMLYDSWTPDNKNAKLPRLNWTDVSSARYVTDYFLEDDTYVRVRTMQLGYNLPQNILKAV